MKIKAEHFATLKSLIEPVKAQTPVPEYVKANPTFSPKRVRWDYYHAAGKDARELLCGTLYQYMNDDHMDTALKAIVGI
jgi:hypothetical protein